jgi:hypothetical protein
VSGLSIGGGANVFQALADQRCRVGVSVCRWLYQVIHDANAVSVFQYILPLMPEFFRFAERACPPRSEVLLLPGR